MTYNSNLLSIQNFQNLDLENLPNEIWKSIPYFGDGYIQVSNLGRVKTSQREFIGKNGILYSIKEKIFKQHIIKYFNNYKNDYYYELRITLRFMGEMKQFNVARLIYSVFVGTEMDYKTDKLIILHKNGNVLDNRIENLVLGTYSDSINKSLHQNRRKPIYEFERHCGYNGKLGEKITQYDASGKRLRIFDNINEAEEQTGIPKSSIYKAIRLIRNQYKASGFFWEYGEGQPYYSKLINYKNLITTTKQRVAKPVMQFDKDGTHIATYTNLIEAQEKTKISKASISNACLGKQAIACGYKWQYKVDFIE